MRAVCAWCGKELESGRPSDVSFPTHGICEECYLGIRVKETVKLLGQRAGPHALFVPPSREDVLLRIWREAPGACLFVAHQDRRWVSRRSRQVPVAIERRTGRDRRTGNLSFVAASPPMTPARGALGPGDPRASP